MDSSTDPLVNVGALEAAEERAFLRGKNAAKLTAQVESHEKRLNSINGSIDRQTAEMRHLATTVQKLGEDFRQSVAVTATRAQDAKETAERQVSTRTFVLGLVSAVAAVGLLLAATGHA